MDGEVSLCVGGGMGMEGRLDGWGREIDGVGVERKEMIRGCDSWKRDVNGIRRETMD